MFNLLLIVVFLNCNLKFRNSVYVGVCVVKDVFSSWDGLFKFV